MKLVLMLILIDGMFHLFIVKGLKGNFYFLILIYL